MQPLNRQETEDLIIDLYYNQKKTFREIQKIVRKAPRDLKNILDKVDPERSSSLSISSRAYQMFMDGSSPTITAIKLNLREKDANEYYREYWKLNELYNLNQIYEEIQEDFPSFVELYRQMKAEGLRGEHVIRLLKIANNDIPSIEYRYQELQSEEASLKAMNQQAARTVQDLVDNIARERQTLEQFRKFVKQQQQEVERLYSEKKGLEDFVNQFRNSNETYTKIKELVKDQIEGGLTSPRQLLRLALASMIETSKKNPDKFQALRYSMPSSKAVKTPLSQSSDVDGQDKQYLYRYANNDDNCEFLLDEAEQLYNKTLEDLANMCIDNLAARGKNNTESALHSFQSMTQLPDVQVGFRLGFYSYRGQAFHPNFDRIENNTNNTTNNQVS